MRLNIGIFLAVVVLLVYGCKTETWDDHYKIQPETISTNVWDAIKGRNDLSRFVEYMSKYKLDTLFKSDNTFTLFIPDNQAIDQLLQTKDIDTTILNYHISQHFILAVDIQGKRKLQTLGLKYSTFENSTGKPTYDGIPLNFESPLYLNGKFFVMGEVALPKPNLYEYFALNIPFLKDYIDKQDSTILDKEKSRPIGFDEFGNTVYDSVSVKVNKIDSMYFPVAKELRVWTSTFVFPKRTNYENALTAMAEKLGGGYHDYTDIPVKWQEEILIPHLLKHGVFLNMLDVTDFKPVKIKKNKQQYNMANIAGDSIVADYTPTDRSLCSNGVVYDYTNFIIPDSLFSGTAKFEGEWLARPTGANKYTWRNGVTVTSSAFFDVSNELIPTASNDSILKVKFTKGYSGTYNLQFKVRNLFPRKYRMVINTYMDYGGLYNVYVNDVLVRTFDYYEFMKARGIIKSVTGATFAPTGRYNRFDCWVDNITEYGRPTIRFEYKGPSTLLPENGLVIDAIEFVPTE